METFDTLNEKTGFANGEEFTSEGHVRDYFTAQNQLDMFGVEAVTSPALLALWADLVITKRWHMKSE